MSLKDNIIHESLKLFSLNGFINTGLSDILEAANTSKGGFYNYFASKEDLFYEVLDEAQRIWRDRVLRDLRETKSPIERIKKLLLNYRDLYLKDSRNFPGGCIFITFSVELDNQRPHLAKEVNKGFVGLKKMLGRYLDEGKSQGELGEDVDTGEVTEILIAGMLGASVILGVDKSNSSLDRSINSLIKYIDSLKS
jgi:AcrR family transcriptional regulator